jgi:chromosome segregation ATPase
MSPAPSKCDEQGKRLDALSERVDILRTAIDRGDAMFIELKRRLDKSEAKQDTILALLDRLNSKLDTVAESIAVHDARLNAQDEKIKIASELAHALHRERAFVLKVASSVGGAILLFLPLISKWLEKVFGW